MTSLAMGLKSGYLGFFADYTRGNKRKQNASTIFACCAVFHTCLSSHSEHSTYAATHLANHAILITGKNPNTPNLSTMPRSKWRRFWDLPCISVHSTHVCRILVPHLSHVGLLQLHFTAISLAHALINQFTEVHQFFTDQCITTDEWRRNEDITQKSHKKNLI